ncbi:MAG: beta-ketoacyl-[acyl-carrier-protein] synthase II, partial [Ignavibacteriaceae bacterium]
MTKKRVVITGLGAVTPIGVNVPDYWQALLSGKNGVAPITLFDAAKFDTKFAAEVKDFNPENYFDKKAVKRLDRFSQFAIASAVQAVDDSEVNLENLNKERCGVVFGSGIGGLETLQNEHWKYFQEKNPGVLSPFFIPMMISDLAAGQISIRFGFKGPNYATTSACATSSHAISDAFMLIQRGSADLMVCGGSEASITEMGVGGFNAMRAISTWNDRYLEASRPFDKDRNGFVMGEGAGSLILEEMNHAIARGAKIYAELAGIGLTADAYHITAPAPGGEGAVRSMKISIEDAGLTIPDIDYINAHGTSTPHNDVNETKA